MNFKVKVSDKAVYTGNIYQIQNYIVLQKIYRKEKIYMENLTFSLFSH